MKHQGMCANNYQAGDDAQTAAGLNDSLLSAPLQQARTSTTGHAGYGLHDLLSDRRTPGLEPRDFLVAIAGGRVTGCAAIWDQRGFKQAIVRGYSQRLARWRRVVNLAGSWLDVPALPAVGRPLPFVYLSHVAIDDDRPDVTAALVSEARRRLPAGVSYMVTAFAEGSPMLLAAGRHRTYRSVLYLACWPDGQRLVESLDARLPHPEVAIL